MTEQEWLTSDDPVTMLEFVTRDGSRPGDGPNRRIIASDRKYRLFALACCDRYGVDADLGPERDRIGDNRAWAMSWSRVGRQSDDGIYSYRTQRSEPDVRAAILRDIVGNPFRAVSPGSVWIAFWRTPQVRSLATAAYEERTANVRCARCLGDGSLTCFKGPGVTHPWRADCESCGKTGYVTDGTLDPFRLMLVADALEDAGCDNTDLLGHLRGLRRCVACARENRRHARQCECFVTGGWLPMSKPPAIGPCVRGCWAIDLMLGKE